MLLPLVIMAALVAAIVASERHGRHSIALAQESVQAQFTRSLQLTELRATSRALQRDALNLLTERDPAALKELGERFAHRYVDFRHGLDTFTPRDARDRAYLATQRDVAAHLATVRQAAARDRVGALRLFQTVLRPSERQASKVADAMITADVARSHSLASEQQELERQVDRQSVMIAVVLTVIAVCVALWSTFSTVLRPLREIGDAMRGLAGGDADIDIPHRTRRDAIGAMARAVEVFQAAARDRDTLRAAADRAHNEATALAQAREAHEARQRADDRRRAELDLQRRAIATEMAAMMESSISTVNEKLRASASRVSKSADSVALNAGAAGRNASRTARSADRVSNDLNQMIAGSDMTTRSMTHLHDETRLVGMATRAASRRADAAIAEMNAMMAHADRVGAMAELIRAVAHKANLLAVNATIEAARVGEAGQGFAVVANEMKGLARQTADATRQVDHQVEAIRETAIATRQSLGEIGDAVNTVERHAALVDEAVEDHRANSAELNRGIGVSLELLESAHAEMRELTATADATVTLAHSLDSEAKLLAADADEVDLALRRVVDHLRAAT
ncbi:MAG: methyl-accepting chemotaxis protein [Sphingomonas sp.]|uniref:methyl-accepting chemotaxis protein n=1 Tax=Sphingomonas sp. TaxID=28214 RepID=UPI001AC938A0|nr:methyl-accepting chemotaxis protein [Sphingomonas sp.]MBN8808874.1 methyl-accepting chemotaxis protein [Sphingomonas sp.]